MPRSMGARCCADAGWADKGLAVRRAAGLSYKLLLGVRAADELRAYSKRSYHNLRKALCAIIAL